MTLAAPTIWTRRAAAAQQLVVRTPGGAYDEVKKRTVYDPFRAATGIEIVAGAVHRRQAAGDVQGGAGRDRCHRHSRRRAIEIYELPVNAFIGRFLGEANLIEGTVKQVADGMAFLRTRDGIVLRAPAGAAVFGQTA